MINPRKSASQIILNDPELAVPLFDLLVWAEKTDLSESEDYDEILDMLWLKIQAGRDARKVYAESRAA